MAEFPIVHMTNICALGVYVFLKKNGEQYPSQPLMCIYKGFNYIFYQVLKDRMDALCIIELQFFMHACPFLVVIRKNWCGE